MPKNLEKWAFFVFLDTIKPRVYMSSVKRTWEHTEPLDIVPWQLNIASCGYGYNSIFSIIFQS